MHRSSLLPSWRTLLALYAVAALTIISVSAIGISVTPSKGKSDSAFYGILFVAVIVAIVAWNLTEKALSKTASSVATVLPFMVQSSFSPAWAMAAGATMMISMKLPAVGTAWAVNTVIEQTIDFS